MRLIGLRLPILAVLVLAAGSVRSQAQVLYMETADWMPTASVLALPTSYVVAGTYAVPTSYAIPSVYATAYVTESAMLAPTTYVAPTYYETRFRRRGLFGRRLVQTTRAYYIPTTAYYPTTYFYPTTFYSPTVLDTAVVSTGYTTTGSSDCCGGTMIAANTATVRSYPSDQAPVATAPAPQTPRPRSAPLRSQAAEEESFDSTVPQLPAREQATKPEASTEAAGLTESPPRPPVPVRQQTTAPPTGVGATQAKPAPPTTGSTGTQALPKTGTPKTAAPAQTTPGGVERPTAPSGADDLQPAPAGAGDDMFGSGTSGRRVSQKPAYTTSRVLRSEYRNVLFGRVKSRDTNEPEEGVRVTLSNRTNTYAERVALTDAFGRFAVKVPDGDWTVNVTMPSGRSYSVSQITVSNGLISDDIGRDIPSLVITR